MNIYNALDRFLIEIETIFTLGKTWKNTCQICRKSSRLKFWTKIQNQSSFIKQAKKHIGIQLSKLCRLFFISPDTMQSWFWSAPYYVLHYLLLMQIKMGLNSFASLKLAIRIGNMMGRKFKQNFHHQESGDKKAKRFFCHITFL